MYPFTDKLPTTKKSKGKNTCEYIIIHHTAWGSYLSNIKYLSSWTAQASVQFVIWPSEECCKIWDPRDISRHAGTSTWWGLTWMNKYSIWIEVVWFGKYNIKQLIRLTDLVEYLMWVYGIPKENVLRHCDLTHGLSKNKVLWDGKSKSRKVDIGLDFFGGSTDDFIKWRDQLTPRTESRYKCDVERNVEVEKK